MSPDTTTTADAIAPHGGSLVTAWVEDADERAAIAERAERLPSVTVDEIRVCDLDMLASGAMSPLTGFMGRADYDGVVDDMRLASGAVWSIPITLPVAEAPSSEEAALRDESGRVLGIVEVEDVYAYDPAREARNVYRTEDPAHPGVAVVLGQSGRYLAGRVRVIARPEPEFPAHALDPAATRAAFRERGWKRIVGFQTRNPIHRAHEYLTKCALETVDGLLVHPLVGKTKAGDIPADVRMRCYETLLDRYYPADRTLLAVFPAAMRYAGPREAIFHALCRKNYGCTHFIVGRDHAGVGSYYGTYDAQRIFDEVGADEIGIEPMMFEHTFWCNGVGGMASTKTTPFGTEDRIVLSGTKVRDMLAAGERPPVEFTRPELADILIDWARST